MFPYSKKSDLSHLEELSTSGTLDNAIANATERRRNSENQEDAPTELLSEQSAQVMGGMVAFPPTTCGMIACEPELF